MPGISLTRGELYHGFAEVVKLRKAWPQDSDFLCGHISVCASLTILDTSLFLRMDCWFTQDGLARACCKPRSQNSDSSDAARQHELSHMTPWTNNLANVNKMHNPRPAKFPCLSLGWGSMHKQLRPLVFGPPSSTIHEHPVEAHHVAYYTRADAEVRKRCAQPSGCHSAVLGAPQYWRRKRCQPSPPRVFVSQFAKQTRHSTYPIAINMAVGGTVHDAKSLHSV